MIKGSKHSKESILQIRKSRKGKGLGGTTGFKKGQVPFNKGKKCHWISERNRILNPLRRGENAYHWKGGTYGTERHREMARCEYKQWRSDVFKRDNWTCQTCQARGVYLEAHHIQSWIKYPELRYEVSNGITLCLPCHKLAFSYKNK